MYTTGCNIERLEGGCCITQGVGSGPCDDLEGWDEGWRGREA